MTATKSWGPTLTEKVGREVDSQVAAPTEARTPNWHRANIAHKECGWKDGDRGGLAQKQKAPGKKNKTVLTLTGLLMEGLWTDYRVQVAQHGEFELVPGVLTPWPDALSASPRECTCGVAVKEGDKQSAQSRPFKTTTYLPLVSSFSTAAIKGYQHQPQLAAERAARRSVPRNNNQILRPFILRILSRSLLRARRSAKFSAWKKRLALSIFFQKTPPQRDKGRKYCLQAAHVPGRTLLQNASLPEPSRSPYGSNWCLLDTEHKQIGTDRPGTWHPSQPAGIEAATNRASSRQAESEVTLHKCSHKRVFPAANY